MQPRFRLRSREDFARLRSEGRSYQNRYLVISFAPNGLNHNRYGFVTSRRLGKAVVRNRVRRVVREVVRMFNPRLRGGMDCVFIVRYALVGQPFSAVQRIVEDMFNQAGLLAESELL
jgi:ribonuclease P protein component